jgi:predicted Zn finger-like uncharacterized protein
VSLATRCPACGTVFRVVRDQLKVSEGWVRCGRCSEVFNAAPRLFELEPDGARPAAPQDRPAAEVHRLPTRDDSGASPVTARVGAALAPSSTTAEPAERAAEAAGAGPSAEPSDGVPAEDRTDSAPQIRDQPVVASAAAASVESSGDADVRTDAASPSEATPDTVEPAGPTPTPEFIRRADLDARWRHPARRGPLAASALLLVALLGGQVALHYRDRVAAAWPATRPGLQAACRMLGCRVDAPRRIDSLNVDSSGLVRMQDSPLYRLSLVLQNKAPTAVRMPAIDLALTDTEGQTTARRVLTAAELGNPAESLPAGGDVTLQATLDLGGRRVAGYTVELFYP